MSTQSPEDDADVVETPDSANLPEPEIEDDQGDSNAGEWNSDA